MKVIVNPCAGGGRAGRETKSLPLALRREGLSGEVFETKEPGHAIEIAKRFVVEGEECIAVMGGDGTFAEVVNAVVGHRVRLGLIAMGSGNDLARSLGLPRNNLSESIRVIARGETLAMDVGWERERVFVSSLGVGFPAAVGEKTKEIGLYRGSALFLAAMFRALRQLTPIDVKLVVDGQQSDRRVVALIIQNTPFTGGGLHTAPEARVDDGFLDVVLVYEVGRINLAWNLPRIYRGTHTNHPKFNHLRCKSVSVESSTPARKLFDGDLVGELPLECKVIPAAVQVFCRVVE